MYFFRYVNSECDDFNFLKVLVPLWMQLSCSGTQPKKSGIALPIESCGIVRLSILKNIRFRFKMGGFESRP